jgi:23S rRNA-/tRNA-specific pseudouridylate synthase
VCRYYVALSEHKPKKKMGTVKGDMTRSRRASWMLQRSTLNPAVTRLTSVAVRSDDSADPRQLWMFVLKPLTGKTHQLRVVRPRRCTHVLSLCSKVCKVRVRVRVRKRQPCAWQLPSITHVAQLF